MKIKIEDQKFNTKIETSDWRYSASIVGLIKYFDYLVSIGYKPEYELYKIDHDSIIYNMEDITEERYLLFVEYYFENAMHHKIIEQILNNSEFTDEQIKLVNDKLKANTIMKKVFSDIRFLGENKKVILEKIKENRLTLIKETYIAWKGIYENFSNKNSLFEESSNICRLQNYNIDTGKLEVHYFVILKILLIL